MIHDMYPYIYIYICMDAHMHRIFLGGCLGLGLSQSQDLISYFTTPVDAKASVPVPTAAEVVASSQKTSPGLLKRLGCVGFRFEHSEVVQWHPRSLLFGGCPTKHGLPQKQFPFFQGH